MVRGGRWFAQGLSLADRFAFDRSVGEMGAERGSPGFLSGDPFLGMPFCQDVRRIHNREG